MTTATIIHPLEAIFGQVNGASIISIDTSTVVPLLGGKANPMVGLVTKVSIGHNVMVFTNKTTNAYENMVEKRLIQEGKDPTSFELKPRTWGNRIQGSPFVEHKGQMYLEVIFLHAGESHYEYQGNVIPPEFIIGLNERHQEAEQGGLDNKVIIRTYNFDSILAVKINKVQHIIR